MRKKSNVFINPGPTQDTSLYQDLFAGAPYPDNPDEYLSLAPGPDRGDARRQEQLDGDVTRMDDFVDPDGDVKTQAEHEGKIIKLPEGNVTVIPGPSRLASGDEMNNSIYSKIYAAMKRIAEDPEKAGKELAGEVSDPQVNDQFAPGLSKEYQAKDEEYVSELPRPEDFQSRVKPNTGKRTVKDFPADHPRRPELDAAADSFSEKISVVIDAIDNFVNNKAALLAAISKYHGVMLASQLIEKRLEAKNAVDLSRANTVFDSKSGKLKERMKYLGIDSARLKDNILVSIQKTTRINHVSVMATLELLKGADMDPAILSKPGVREIVEKKGKAISVFRGAFEGGLKERLNDTTKKAASAEMFTDMSVTWIAGVSGLKARVDELNRKSKILGVNIKDLLARSLVPREDFMQTQTQVGTYISMLGSISSLLSDDGEETKKASLSVNASDTGKGIDELASMMEELESGLEDLSGELARYAKEADKIMSGSDVVSAYLDAVQDLVGYVSPVMDALLSFMDDASVLDSPATDEVQTEAEPEADGPGWWDEVKDSATHLMPSAPQIPAYALAARVREMVRMAGEEYGDFPDKTILDIPGMLAEMPDGSEHDGIEPSGDDYGVTPYMSESDLARLKSLRDKEKFKLDAATLKQKEKEEKYKKDMIEKGRDPVEEKRLLAARESLSGLLIEYTRLHPQIVEATIRAAEIRRICNDSSREYKEGLGIQPNGPLRENSAAAFKKVVDSYKDLFAQAESFRNLLSDIMGGTESTSRYIFRIIGKIHAVFRNTSDSLTLILMKKGMEKSATVGFSRMVRDLEAGSYLASKEYKEGLDAINDIMKIVFGNTSEALQLRAPPKTKRKTPAGEQVLSLGGPPTEIYKVREELQPGIDSAQELLEEGKDEMQQINDMLNEKSSAGSPLIRQADGDAEEDQTDYQAMADLLAEASKALAEAEVHARNVLSLMPKIKEDTENEEALLEKFEANINKLKSGKSVGEWAAEIGGKVMDKAKAIGKGIGDALMPAQPELSPAAASKENAMEREAGEFDRFDVSMNRLEIVEGEDGKKRLVMNKGLKSLVSRRLQENMYGAYKCGDTVQVDFDDYLGFGTVKAYISSSSSYRIEVDGAVMEVPAKNVMSFDGNPWRA